MNKNLNIQKSLLIFGVPILIIGLMIALANSSLFYSNTNKLSLAITVDLLITTPLVYFLLIRKTKIPRTTIVPFIILGIIIATYILPSENQYYLSLFKTWVLPLIELVILSFIVYKVIKAIREYNKRKVDNYGDFFTVLKSTCNEILPKLVAIPFVTEIAVFYYGFINWKKHNLKTNEFTYHKESGTIGLLVAILFLIAIETVALHLLLSKWNITAAWILTGISIYSGIQILGFLKSMYKRPIMVKNNILYLRYGIMNETIIKVNDIDTITLSSKDLTPNQNTRKLSIFGNLEGHNTVIKLKKENFLTGLYGIKRSYKVIALHIDKKQEFKNLIEKELNSVSE